ncbi:MAG: hypothetical protein H7326_00245 [Bdellovibrionaceae bacterium]|nr:hypothetical protein [Pseudobdellovibrionaceae bacterium]
MSLNTGIGFFLLALGLLSVRSNTGIGAVFSSRDLGGTATVDALMLGHWGLWRK